MGRVCLAGSCEVSPANEVGADAVNEQPLDLVIRKFALRPLGKSRLRLVAKASFASTMLVEPDRTGMTVEIDGAGGHPLYTASVPSYMFEANYVRTRFLYAADSAPPPKYAGLKLLTVMTGGRRVVVTAKAIVPAALLASPALVGASTSKEPAVSAFIWTIRWAAHCGSDPVVCSTGQKCRRSKLPARF